MRIKMLLAVTLFAGFNHAWAGPYVTDTIAVDSVYNEKNSSITLPIVDFKSGRYSTKVLFDTFVRQPDGSYTGSFTLNPLVSLNDSNIIVMDKDFDPVIADKLKAFLQQHITDWHKPGAIIRVDMNGKVWRGVIGKRRVNSPEPLNFSDRHRVGSITKTFVCNTVMQLVQQGVLDLDATIDKYIPEVKIHNKDKITIRDLIAHRTGLFNYVLDIKKIQDSMQKNPLKVFEPEDLIAISNSQPVDFLPGTTYKYSNTGLILAGLIIEKVTGKPIVQAVHERTIKRLGLMRTEFPVDPGIQSNYMHGHADYNNDGVLSSKEIVTYLDPSVSWAAGAIISSLDDLSKWFKSYVDGTLINKQLQNEVLSDCLPSSPDYGASYCLGMVKITWPFDTTDPTQWWFGHLGQINGYDNVVFRNTSKNITLAMTNNNYYLSTPVDEGNGILIFNLLNIIEPQPAANAAFVSAKTKKLLNPEDLGGQ